MSGTIRVPVFVSGSRISPVSKLRSSHRSPRISLRRRHPVSTRSRMAAPAWVEASRFSGAVRNASPSR